MGNCRLDFPSTFLREAGRLIAKPQRSIPCGSLMWEVQNFNPHRNRLIVATPRCRGGLRKDSFSQVYAPLTLCCFLGWNQPCKTFWTRSAVVNIRRAGKSRRGVVGAQGGAVGRGVGIYFLLQRPCSPNACRRCGGPNPLH